MTDWHSVEIHQAFQKLDTCPEGLAETEAADRLKRRGANLLKPARLISQVKIFLKQFANYFILVLLFAAGLAFAISGLPGQADHILTAYFILVIILLSVLLSFYEEFRSQRELEALNRLLSFHTRVIRDGERKEIDAALVVPGDVVVLSQG